MNDLKPHVHGEEGTHAACQEMIDKNGGAVVCCQCTGHVCDTVPTANTPTVLQLNVRKARFGGDSHDYSPQPDSNELCGSKYCKEHHSPTVPMVHSPQHRENTEPKCYHSYHCKCMYTTCQEPHYADCQSQTPQHREEGWGSELGQILADFEQDKNEVKAVYGISELIRSTVAEALATEHERLVRALDQAVSQEVHFCPYNDGDSKCECAGKVRDAVLSIIKGKGQS